MLPEAPAPTKRYVLIVQFIFMNYSFNSYRLVNPFIIILFYFLIDSAFVDR